LDTSESKSEIPGKFWNVVLVKDGGYLPDLGIARIHIS